MTTLNTMAARYGVEFLDHLDRAVSIPVISTLAAQGDVLIRRVDDRGDALTPIPDSGYPVVRGEVGRNTHAVYGAGFYDPASGGSQGDLLLGVLTVPVGGQVLLSHPEHGGFLIEPGTYELRRQREQADEIRMVAD